MVNYVFLTERPASDMPVIPPHPDLKIYGKNRGKNLSALQCHPNGIQCILLNTHNTLPHGDLLGVSGCQVEYQRATSPKKAQNGRSDLHRHPKTADKPGPKLSRGMKIKIDPFHGCESCREGKLRPIMCFGGHFLPQKHETAVLTSIAIQKQPTNLAQNSVVG